jgi:putative ABC transport system permease protein
MGAVAGVAFGYPILQMAGYIALAGVAALLASVIPARRAARLTVIDGLAAE